MYKYDIVDYPKQRRVKKLRLKNRGAMQRSYSTSQIMSPLYTHVI